MGEFFEEIMASINETREAAKKNELKARNRYKAKEYN